MKRTIGLTGLLCLLIVVTGCISSRFPYMGSYDRHNFVSTTDMPLTVTLRDTVTGEDLINVDVPVGRMLVIDLEHKEDWTASQGNAMVAEKVAWEVLDVGTIMPGFLANKMQLPGNAVMLKVTVRDAEPTGKGKMDYQPVETGNGDSPAYTPQGPATREISEPETGTDTAPAETPADEPAMRSDTGESDTPTSTPQYTPAEPEDTSDLEGVLE